MLLYFLISIFLKSYLMLLYIIFAFCTLKEIWSLGKMVQTLLCLPFYKLAVLEADCFHPCGCSTSHSLLMLVALRGKKKRNSNLVLYVFSLQSIWNNESCVTACQRVCIGNPEHVKVQTYCELTVAK